MEMANKQHLLIMAQASSAPTTTKIQWPSRYWMYLMLKIKKR